MDRSSNINHMEALFRFDHLNAGVKEHLKKTYSCLFIALLSASAAAYVQLGLGMLQGLGFLTLLGTIGLIFWLRSIPHEPKNEAMRTGILMGIGFVTGLSAGPLLQHAAYLDPSLIVTAFIATTVIFGSFTLAALFAKDRSMLYLGGTLMTAAFYLSIAGLANIFFRSNMIFQAQVYIGLVVFCGFVLYDTQMIIEKYRMGERDHIWHAVELFIDFVAIFKRILIILTQKEEGDRRRKRR